SDTRSLRRASGLVLVGKPDTERPLSPTALSRLRRSRHRESAVCSEIICYFLCMKTALYGRIVFGRGGAVRRHRTDAARRCHLAKLATYLEPAFRRPHWRVSHDRSNCRWNWDAVPAHWALGFGRTLRCQFVFLAGLYP